MRIVELALESYGPFAGAKLQFDCAAKLHIVHGPNEAGKSSALAAIGDLFYGVPRSEKNFLRPADLRLGATVQARNGQMLQFFRQRGVKATLRDAGGAALPDDCLAPFLGAASRDIFHRAFGLDAESLRNGGDEMLRAEGEIGASLFAAASGLRGLIDLRKGLEAEADEIFGERKAERRSFYQALARYDEATKAEKEARLTETALKSLRRQIEEAEAALAELKARERADAAEQIRLNRLLRAAPILKNLQRLRESFAAFDDVSAFAPDWAEQLEALLAGTTRAGEAAAHARTARDAAREEAESIGVDDEVLARAAAIDALHRDGGAMEKALDDLFSRRENALREAREKLRLRALVCGLNDGAALRAAQPDAAVLARAERLISIGRDLSARKIEPMAALEREEKALAILRAKQGAAPPDTRTLAEKLAAFGAVEKDEDSRAELALACAEDARKLDERRARLVPALPDLEKFAAAPSPDAPAIEQAAQAFEALSAGEAEARRQGKEADARLKAAQAQVAALEKAGAVVSRADLADVRARRDALWRDLPGLRTDEALWTQASKQFLDAQAQADAAADALFENAARVVEMEAARAELAAAQSALAEAEEAARALAEQAARENETWRQDWSACGVVPAPPRRMARWRAEADNLLAARDALRERQARLAALESRLRGAVPGLERLATQAGLDPIKLDAGALAKRIAARIGEFSRAESEARELAAKIADAPERIGALKQTLAELEEKEMLWRGDFAAALAHLRLDADASLDEAQARIALWRDLPGELQEEASESRRVETIRDDLAAFERKLDALLGACGRDLPARPAVEAARALHERLTAERNKDTTRAAAQKQLAKAEAAVAEAEQAAAEAEARLAAFCADAGFAGDAAALSARLSLRRAQRQAIEAETARLAPVAEGVDEASLAAQAESFDADSARLRLSEIAREREAREKLRDAALLAQHDAKRQLQAHDDGAGAEQAAFEREAAKAEMAAEARRWAVLKIASLMVGAGLERHRQTRQDPLLARAGAIYATLTSGRYRGLKQDFAEDEKLHLLALRRDGAALSLAALSEGARDQLYLALRLAFLEDYAQKSEAPPFIGDDLFASFDDARVASGLRTLADLSPALQPILFTHHDHVVAIATKTLGAAARVLRLDPA
jgi:uncharacterized protein YhaN